MPAFDFSYNIGDIVNFAWQNKQETIGGTTRGTVKGILIGKEKSGYMIEHCNGLEFVECSRVQNPVFSTKSFDVFYPNLEVEYRVEADPESFIYAKVVSAFIKRGKLFYNLKDSGGNYYVAPEGLVLLVDSKKNQNKFK